MEAPYKTQTHDALKSANLQLDRSLKTAFRYTITETAALIAAVALVFWLLSVSDAYIGTKFAVIALILGTLLSHCCQLLRQHECRSLVLRQAEISAKDRAKTNRLYDLSVLDPLTGLHNRRFGEQNLKDEIARSQKTGDCLAVVLMDLDYFKEINDQFGHAVGDLALKEFARCLKKAIRACDTPVRLGGDEFLLVLPDCPRDKVSVILQRVGTPTIQHDGIKIHICYSSGSSHFEHGDTSEKILSRADEVLYAKKAARSSTPPNASPFDVKILTKRAPSGIPIRNAGGIETAWLRP
jgi:diguanylate cyclase (GGDEF)-like protein